MTEMSLPELARVLLEGSSRGRESAQYLLHRKVRELRGAPGALDVVDTTGASAAQILVGSRDEMAMESFLHLLHQGAKAPEGTESLVAHYAGRGKKFYLLLDCAHTLEQEDRPLLPAQQGNLLHVIAGHPQALLGLVEEITDIQRAYMHRWQGPVFAWLTQARGIDGATPLHIALHALPVDDESLLPFLHGLLKLAPVLDWYVRQGGSFSLRDHDGNSVCQLIEERLHMLDSPARLGAHVRAELQRARLDLEAPDAPTAPRRRI